MDDVTYPGHAVATVTSDVDGDYTVTVAGKPYTVTVTDGTATVDIDQLDVGEYTAELTAEIPNYNPVKESDSFEIIEGVITLHLVVDELPILTILLLMLLLMLMVSIILLLLQ